MAPKTKQQVSYDETLDQLREAVYTKLCETAEAMKASLSLTNETLEGKHAALRATLNELNILRQQNWLYG